jgi:hypothetical protein
MNATTKAGSSADRLAAGAAGIGDRCDRAANDGHESGSPDPQHAGGRTKGTEE